MTDLIERLDKDIFTDAVNSVNMWEREVLRRQPLDRNLTRQVVADLYRLLEIDAPEIVICQSPWQMLVMPILLLCRQRLAEQLLDMVDEGLVEIVHRHLCDTVGIEQTRHLFDRLSEYENIPEPGDYVRYRLVNMIAHKVAKDDSFKRMSNFIDSRASFNLRTYYESLLTNLRLYEVYDVLHEYMRRLPVETTWAPVPEQFREKFDLSLSLLMSTSSLIADHYFDASQGLRLASLLFTRELIEEKCFLDIELSEQTRTFCQLMDAGHMFLPFKNVCFVCDFPTDVWRNDDGLHRLDGPALSYSDGSGVFACYGRLADKGLIKNLSDLKVDQIESEGDPDRRRVMIQTYGRERYLRESKAPKFRLDHQVRDRARAHLDLFMFAANRTDRIDRQKVESVVAELYMRAGMPPPAVFHCQSPWQMCMMPSLMVCQGKRNEELTRKIGKPVLDLIESHLSNQCGEKMTHALMTRMNEQIEASGVSEPGRTEVRVSLLEVFIRDLSSYTQEYTSLFHNNRQFVDTVGLFQRAHTSSIGRLVRETLANTPPDNMLPFVGLEYRSIFLEAMIAEFGTDSLIMPHYFDSSIWFPVGAYQFIVDCLNEHADSVVSLEIPSHHRLLLQMVDAAHMYFPFEHVCFVSDRPVQVYYDRERGYHSGNSPAVIYEDGFNCYFWRSVRIPESFIRKRDLLSVDQINAQRNIEYRRVLTEMYGWERFIKDSGAEPLLSDKYGTLYEVEDARILKVKNATIEEDGTQRDYWLRVPPWVQTPKAAVAWTFDMEEYQYEPDVES